MPYMDNQDKDKVWTRSKIISKKVLPLWDVILLLFKSMERSIIFFVELLVFRSLFLKNNIGFFNGSIWIEKSSKKIFISN